MVTRVETLGREASKQGLIERILTCHSNDLGTVSRNSQCNAKGDAVDSKCLHHLPGHDILLLVQLGEGLDNQGVHRVTTCPLEGHQAYCYVSCTANPWALFLGGWKLIAIQSRAELVVPSVILLPRKLMLEPAA